MNDETHEILVRAASMTDEAVARLPLSGAETALLEEIMSTPVLVEPVAEPSRGRRRRWLVPAAVAAALTLLAGTLWLTGDDGGVPVDGEGGTPGYSADPVQVAEANSRVLVDAPGWRVTRVDEFTVSQGEMTFENGQRRLEVFWYPRERHEEWVADRRNSSKPVGIEVLGKQGLMFRDDSRSRHFDTILPPEGPTFLEIRGHFADEQAYREILAALITVDVQTWLDALPASVVKPGGQSAAVDEMLSDIPLPPGFDRSEITLSPGATSRYYTGAVVVSEVTCGWIEHWREGLRSGDDEAVADAVAAMGSSRSWAVLREMDEEGGHYPEAIWETADQMADGELIMDDKLGRSATCGELGFGS